MSTSTRSQPRTKVNQQQLVDRQFDEYWYGAVNKKEGADDSSSRVRPRDQFDEYKDEEEAKSDHDEGNDSPVAAVVVRRDQFDDYDPNAITQAQQQQQQLENSAGQPLDPFSNYKYAKTQEDLDRERRQRFMVGGVCLFLFLIIIIIIAVVLARNSGGRTSSSEDDDAATPSPTPLLTTLVPATSVPTAAAALAPSPRPTQVTTEPTLSPTPAPITFPPTPSPTTSVEGLIKDKALQGGEEFEDPNSPQSQALAWIQTPANLAQNWTEEQILQRYALAVLQYATDGENWDPSIGGWLTSLDMCFWSGLLCNDERLVQFMELPNVGMNGYIPEEIIFLGDTLTNMALENNTNLRNSGDDEYEFFNGLPNLKYLGIQNTGMEHDGIPTQIGSMKQLRDLEAQGSQWGRGGGPIPEEAFDGLTELSYLDLRGVTFEGTIPQSLLNLPSLRYAYFEGATIEGGLGWLSDLLAIEEIWVDNCRLNGTLPTFLPPTLFSLSVTSNELMTGSIPESFCENSKFEFLYLYANDLVGEIPSCFANFRSLGYFWFQFNGAMSGSVDFMCPLYEIGSMLGMSNDVGVNCSCCFSSVVDIDVAEAVPPPETTTTTTTTTTVAAAVPVAADGTRSLVRGHHYHHQQEESRLQLIDKSRHHDHHDVAFSLQPKLTKRERDAIMMDISGRLDR